MSPHAFCVTNTTATVHRLPLGVVCTSVTAMQWGSATTDSPADSRPELWSTLKHVRPPFPLPFVPSFTPPSGPSHWACLRTDPHQPTAAPDLGATWRSWPSHWFWTRRKSPSLSANVIVCRQFMRRRLFSELPEEDAN